MLPKCVMITQRPIYVKMPSDGKQRLGQLKII